MKKLEKTTTFSHSMTLREFRNTFGIPQKVFAPIIGVSQPTYSRMENEEKEYSPEDLEKIFEKLKNEKSFTLRKTTKKYINDNMEAPTIELELKELKQENKELRNTIERLFSMLEIKHTSMLEKNNHN